METLCFATRGTGSAPDAQTVEVLREALEDEFRARAAYRKVIEAFGPVRPFVNIVEAEDRHAQALLALFAAFGVEPPPDSWPERVGAPASFAEACRAGVQAEIMNEAMYDRLLRRTSHPAVLAVLRRLQRASRERHLPAFQRCLARESGASGRGPGGPQRRRARAGARSA
jgi:rubrerythrin